MLTPGSSDLGGTSMVAPAASSCPVQCPAQQFQNAAPDSDSSSLTLGWRSWAARQWVLSLPYR
jgi:hypothetical protein